MNTRIKATFLEMSESSASSVDLSLDDVLISRIELLDCFVGVFWVKDRHSLFVTSWLQLGQECRIFGEVQLLGTRGTWCHVGVLVARLSETMIWIVGEAVCSEFLCATSLISFNIIQWGWVHSIFLRSMPSWTISQRGESSLNFYTFSTNKSIAASTSSSVENRPIPIRKEVWAKS